MQKYITILAGTLLASEQMQASEDGQTPMRVSALVAAISLFK